jgi:hypothetical protein
MKSIKRSLCSLTNEQLSKRLKNKPNDDHEEFISKTPINDIIGNGEGSDYDDEETPHMKIGIKPGQAIFEVPDIDERNQTKPIPRQDGLRWDPSVDQSDVNYSRDWINEEKERKMLLQKDPNYKFMTLVAGHTKYETEDLYAVDQNESLRNKFFEAQQTARTRTTNDPAAVRNIIKSKQSIQTTLEASLRYQTNRKEAIEQLTPEYEMTLRNVYKFIDMKNLFFPSQLTVGGNLNTEGFRLAESITAPVKELSGYIWKYMSEDKDVLVNGIFSPIIADVGNLGNVDTPKVLVVLEQDTTVDVTRGGLIALLKNVDESKFIGIVGILLVSDTNRNQFIIRLYLYFVEQLNKMNLRAGALLTWQSAHNFLRSAVAPGATGSGLKAEIIDRITSFFKSYKRHYKFFTDEGSGIYKAGEVSSVLVTKKSDVWKKFVNGFSSVTKNFTEYTTEFATRTNPIERVNLLSQLLEKSLDLLPTYGGTYDACIRLFDELKEFTDEQFEDIDNRTDLFKSIILSSRILIQDDAKAQFLEEKSIENPFYYILYYDRVLFKFLEKSVAEVSAEIQALTEDIARLQKYLQDMITGAKVISVPDIIYPYKHKASWVLNPRHSGIVELKPIVVTAIAEAKRMLQSKVDPHIPREFIKLGGKYFEQLQRVEDVDVLLAKLVSTCMAFPSINFPEQYRFRDSAFMAQKNQADVLKDLRDLRIKKEGRNKFVVGIAERKDPLKF